MKLWKQYQDVIMVNWHVGFTAFGGPAVQFQTVRNIVTTSYHICFSKLIFGQFHERFVKTLGWIDEPMVPATMT